MLKFGGCRLNGLSQNHRDRMNERKNERKNEIHTTEYKRPTFFFKDLGGDLTTLLFFKIVESENSTESDFRIVMKKAFTTNKRRKKHFQYT